MGTRPKITIHHLQERKRCGEKITALTAYDATFARLFDSSGVDVLLVGDSLGMVIQGESTTLPVRLEHVIYHTQAVSRGTQSAHIVADMPFMSYQASPEDAVRSAGRLVQEGNAEAVKLEGGSEIAEGIERIVGAGIPVMGHIGLMPQSFHRMGGYRVQGKDARSARNLIRDARDVQEAGAYAIVLEGIPAQLAAEITQTLSIPTIGIGAGELCDGQVLVSYDMLGMDSEFQPKFVKRFAELHATITDATRNFIHEVKTGDFPSADHAYRARGVSVVPPEDGSESGVHHLYTAPKN